MTWGEIWQWVRGPKSALAVVTGVLAAFALGGAVATKGLWSQETAAWVQAIGSVAAIVGAIWIDRGAARRAQEDRSEAAARAVLAAHHLAVMLEIKLTATIELAEEDGHVRSGEPIRLGYQTLARSINAFPITTLTDVKAFGAFSTVMETAEVVVDFLAKVDALAEKAEEEGRTLQTVTDLANEHLPALLEILKGQVAILKAAAERA